MLSFEAIENIEADKVPFRGFEDSVVVGGELMFFFSDSADWMSWYDNIHSEKLIAIGERYRSSI